MSKRDEYQANRGFTIIELLVIAPVVILTIGAFIAVIVNMTGEVLATRAANVLAYDIQDTLTRIEEDVRLSSTFLAESNITMTAPQGFDNGTTTFKNIDSTNGNMLILNTLATTDNPLFEATGLIYLANQPNGCTSPSVTQNKPMAMNIVYFVLEDPVTEVNSLWRRTIAASDYATAGCAVPWQQPSCNPTFMTQSPGSSTFCRTQDTRLLDYVDPADFVIEYFTSADTTTADTVASTDPDIADRNAALQSATTVGVTINVSKTAGGREISQSSRLRATKLDINASTLAPVTATTPPGTPAVSTSINNPTSVVVTWPAVSGAESYTVDYNVNGGAWINGFTGQNTTSYTVPEVAHTDTVNTRVSATNTAGTSTFGTSSITIPRWTPFVLQNNWTDYGNVFSTSGYTKTSAGMVVLKGLVKGGTVGCSTPIATLPVGYRPEAKLIFENSSNSAVGRLDVDLNGEVRACGGSNAWFSLDGFTFMPSDVSFTGLTPLLNGWINYGSAHADAAYMTDSNGRVHVKGVIRNGTVAGGTPIDNLPVGSRPSEYLHMVNYNSGAAGHISIDNSGNLLAKGGGNGFLSTQAMFIPSGRATGTNCTTQWCNISPLLNGWVWYGGIYATPQYTKTADGMVLLKGLIRSGSSYIADLPAGYCPKQQLLLTNVAADAWGRLDITAATSDTSGCRLLYAGGSTTWFSLDAATWMAEW